MKLSHYRQDHPLAARARAISVQAAAAITAGLVEKHRRGVPQQIKLPKMIAAKAQGRTEESQVTNMLNHLGLGLQFSAAAARVYELVKMRGLGQQHPGEWLCQDELVSLNLRID